MKHVLIAIITIVTGIGVLNPAPADAEAMCWKDSYGRGVGTIPIHCPPGKENDAGLCYVPCQNGYDGVGPVCWQRCPSGYHDDGAFCRKDAHIFGSDNSDCPWYDVCGIALAAGCSHCPSGYINDGCTCRRDVHIFAKHSYGRGVGTIPDRCAGGEEYDAGLCYDRCRSGFDGVGPVCWSICGGNTPVECGAQCGSSSLACFTLTFQQVTQPFIVILNLTNIFQAGYGAASAAFFRASGQIAAQKLATEAGKASAKAALKITVLNVAKDRGISLTADGLNSLLSGTIDASASGEFDWRTLDPTGIAKLIDVYDQPICGSEPVDRVVCTDETGCRNSSTGAPVPGGFDVTDTDGDILIDRIDNCPAVPNLDQADRDGDGAGDACDACPDHSLKTAPGACGCATRDTDSDRDGTPNCIDGCANDAGKTAPGVCGCGTPETDTDGDGTPDCADACAFDPDKTEPGDCGCGVSENAPFCRDACKVRDEPFDGDPAWTAINNPADEVSIEFAASDLSGGPSGGGELRAHIRRSPETHLLVDETVGGPYSLDDVLFASGELNVTRMDADFNTGVDLGHLDSTTGVDVNGPMVGLHIAEFTEGYRVFIRIRHDGVEHRAGPLVLARNVPREFTYVWDPEAGVNGGGELSLNISGVDGGALTIDLTPAERAAVSGLRLDAFGLGASALPVTTCYTDCPAGYRASGSQCLQNCAAGYIDRGTWCERPETTASPNNAACNWFDLCGAFEPCLTCSPGFNLESCFTCRRPRHTYNKASIARPSGRCLAGHATIYVDGLRYTADEDCDLCPDDDDKTTPGVCGCGVAETDSDGDGTEDCGDACPNEPSLIAEGACGCAPVTDADADGTPDCDDACPDDPSKTVAGVCGCGTPDLDADGDGLADCVDPCPTIHADSTCQHAGECLGEGDAICLDEDNRAVCQGGVLVPESCGVDSCEATGDPLVGGGACHATDFYCAAGVCETTVTQGADTCGGTADAPTVTVYGCVGPEGAPNACAPTEVERMDTCADSGTAMGGGQCSAVDYTCVDGLMTRSVTGGEDTCGGTDDAPAVSTFSCVVSSGEVADRCAPDETTRADSCTDSGSDFGGGSCSATNWVCQNGTLVSDTTGGEDMCAGTDQTPQLNYFACAPSDGDLDDRCVVIEREEADTCDDSGDALGGGSCAATDWVCADGNLTRVDTEGTDTCGGDADRPSVSAYACQASRCVAEVTVRADRCVDSGSALGGGTCQATDWACADGRLAHDNSHGVDACGGNEAAPNVTYYACEATGGAMGDTCVPAETQRQDGCADGSPDDGTCAISNWSCGDGRLSSQLDDTDRDGVPDTLDPNPNNADVPCLGFITEESVPGLEGVVLDADAALGRTRMGDFDGDGLADVLYLQDDGDHWVAYGRADGGFAHRPQVGGVEGLGFAADATVVALDVDGDGRRDVVRIAAEDAAWAGVAADPFDAMDPIGGLDGAAGAIWRKGDFNGDGRDDLVRLGGQGPDALFLAQADRSFVPVPNPMGLSPAATVLVGDLDGDGRQDLVGLGDEGGHWIAFAVDGGFTRVDAPAGLEGEAVTGRVLLGDHDGDGDADLVHLAEDGDHWLALSEGDGSFDLRSAPAELEGMTYQVDDRVFAGDFDGDGLADVLALGSAGAHWVALANGDGGFHIIAAPTGLSVGFTADPGISRIHVGDFDGDGLDDVLHLEADGAHWLARSNLALGCHGHDKDGDGVPDADDDAPRDANGCRDVDDDGCDDCANGGDDPADDGPDADGDGRCDAGDICPHDPEDDADGDTICAPNDRCPGADDRIDADGDGTPDCIDDCPADPLKVQPGVCDCGTPDDDGDGDQTPDCVDACPEDAGKTEPGVCGCGTADTDGDDDGTPDCDDACPTDAAKIAPGVCGCDVSEADADGDATPDCVDGCPADPAKVEAGICGCGVVDFDTDDDGTADCLDACALDPAKTAPGVCGCGESDADGDADGTADCIDDCPVDGAKIAPGRCGCGVADTDTDADQTPDCEDDCPADPAKIEPGICGCGERDADSDGDGTADCVDGCPGDAGKVAAGVCGCGMPDTDSDGDGTADCIDGCPQDGAKIAVGVCGCGVADTDGDGDGAADCVDGCPADAAKVEAGTCGCGVADTDGDVDGVADCNDGCPADGMKIEAGICGCGVADNDSDGDGTADCHDGCPHDTTKQAPGLCGCGAADIDGDADGAVDCLDDCPLDPAKVEVGVCGCGVADDDADGDGLADCIDGCPADAAKVAPGQCGCGIADTDSDSDGVADCADPCPLDPTDGAADGDGVCNDVDNCAEIANADQLDTDGDGIGDACDVCPADAEDDADGDGVCGDVDNCVGDNNPDQTDSDGDGAGDVCDSCPLDALDDEDADGLCADEDPCPVDGANDADGDGHCESADNCAEQFNPSQYDHDNDGVGDLCGGEVCEIVRKACNRHHRAEVRSCALTHNICRRECPRRDRACRDACRDARVECESTAADALITCLDETECVPRRECKAAARADHRLCREGAQSAYRSCRQSCKAPGAPEACKAECRATWRAERDECRVNRRTTITQVCLEPFDAASECRAVNDACLAAAQDERRACRADCANNDAAGRAACNDEHDRDRISCIEAHAVCLDGL